MALAPKKMVAVVGGRRPPNMSICQYVPLSLTLMKTLIPAAPQRPAFLVRGLGLRSCSCHVALRGRARQGVFFVSSFFFFMLYLYVRVCSMFTLTLCTSYTRPCVHAHTCIQHLGLSRTVLLAAIIKPYAVACCLLLVTGNRLHQPPNQHQQRVGS